MHKTNFSVSSLMNIYSNTLTSSLDGKLVVLEGFYSDKKGKLYKDSFYDEIIDKDRKHTVTIQLSEALKSKLSADKYFEFEGFINKGQTLENDSRLKVFFRVTKILKYEQEIQLIPKEEYDIIRSRIDRDFPFIHDMLFDKLKQKKKPVIDIIIGINSTSTDDYKSELQDAENYDIRHHRCNLSSQTEILDFLSKHNFRNTDLLIVLRGGGSGLELFNDIELCKRFIEIPVPFITGIGHDKDKTLLQRVADKGFSTPTAVGIFLQSIVNRYKGFQRDMEDKNQELEHYLNQAEKEKKVFEIQMMEQKKMVTKVWLLVACLMVIILFLIFLFLK